MRRFRRRDKERKGSEKRRKLEEREIRDLLGKLDEDLDITPED
ncbi:MAG: hypothetical protein QW567_01225 [Candidatus Hadarchaeales archaeon]